MARRWCTSVWAIAIAASIACGSSSSSPTSSSSVSNNAAIVIAILTATVEPLTTTPQPGLVYRVTYQVRESAGRMGATLVGFHFAFSNGSMADGNFNSATTPPHVAASGTITASSSYSIYPASMPASHVTFTVTYTDDAGKTGTVTAEADIARVGL